MSEKLDSLIIIDRRVDMISPLLTQLTYEGLIDELIGMRNCRCSLCGVGCIAKLEFKAHVEVPVSLLNPPAGPGQPAGSASSSTAPQSGVSITKEKKKKHHLTTATDPLFAELRDLNFSSVGKKLNQVARRLDEDYKVALRVKVAALCSCTFT